MLVADGRFILVADAERDVVWFFQGALLAICSNSLANADILALQFSLLSCNTAKPALGALFCCSADVVLTGLPHEL